MEQELFTFLKNGPGLVKFNYNSNEIADLALKFYKENSGLLPILSKIAKFLLSIPATSVPSESVFSVAGDIQNEQRSRLNPELLNYLEFY